MIKNLYSKFHIYCIKMNMIVEENYDIFLSSMWPTRLLTGE